MAKGLVKPSKSIAATHMRQPTTMYGLLRPKRDLELSASTPGEVEVGLRLRGTGRKRTNKRLDDESRYRSCEEDHGYCGL